MLDPRKNNVTDVSAVLSQLEGDPATLAEPDSDSHLARSGRHKWSTKLQARRTIPNSIRRWRGPASDTWRPIWRQSSIPATGSRTAPPIQSLRDRILDNFLKHVSADANGLSTAITVSATSRDAAKAARIANALVDAYIDDQVATKRNAASGTADWLDQRIHDLAQQLQEQEAAIAAYKARAWSERFRARQFAGGSADGGHQRPDRAGALRPGGKTGAE